MIKQWTYGEIKRIKYVNFKGIIDHGNNFSIIPLEKQTVNKNINK